MENWISITDTKPKWNEVFSEHVIVLNDSGNEEIVGLFKETDGTFTGFKTSGTPIKNITQWKSLPTEPTQVDMAKVIRKPPIYISEHKSKPEPKEEKEGWKKVEKSISPPSKD